MKKKIICFLFTALLGVCVFIHRSVIYALIKGEELPPAPSWHFWCSNRK
ncbi:MAG: hypothetical protein IJU66_02755 [Oscillospiraceae bacterium]|nr:hypothetical protein [Oscillospiraceae bacterium]